MSVVVLDQRPKLVCARRRQSHMGGEERVAVAFRSNTKRLGERRRLDGMIDRRDFIEIPVSPVGEGNRYTIGSCPAVTQKHGDDIVQSAPVE
jgi:hypothetical protein